MMCWILGHKWAVVGGAVDPSGLRVPTHAPGPDGRTVPVEGGGREVWGQAGHILAGSSARCECERCGERVHLRWVKLSETRAWELGRTTEPFLDVSEHGGTVTTGQRFGVRG